jgi:hypothetical protein
MIRKYIKNIFIAINQLIILGENPDGTISLKLGKYQRNDYNINIKLLLYFISKIVVFIFFLLGIKIIVLQI